MAMPDRASIKEASSNCAAQGDELSCVATRDCKLIVQTCPVFEAHPFGQVSFIDPIAQAGIDSLMRNIGQSLG